MVRFREISRFLVSLCIPSLLPVAESDGCRDALGMKDGTIEDGDISASSRSSLYQQWWPWYARLDGEDAWFPSEPSGSWIQVDLRQRKTVSGVTTQGYDGPGIFNYWVITYEVRYLRTSGAWEAIKTQTGNAKTFSGNVNQNDPKTNLFDSPIVAQKIRLYPTDWRRQPGLRMELLGCDLIASTTQSTTIDRATSTASQTVLDGGHEGRIGPRGSLGVGAIAGIAAGVSVVLIALVMFVIIFLRKRQLNNKGESNAPKNPPEQRFRNPEYSDVTAANEHTAPAQDEGFTDCELYNTEDSNPYESYNYANSGQISGGEISQPSHDYDYATIPGESDRGVVDNVIYETSDMT